MSALVFAADGTFRYANLTDAPSPLRVGEVEKPVPAGYDPATWRPTAAFALAESAAIVEQQQVAAIKADAEQRKMAMLTSGGAKKFQYNAQAGEVLAWKQLGVVGASVTTLLGAFNLLPATERAARFPFAIAWAAANPGKTVADAIARFEAGMAASTPEIARLSAIEDRACQAVRAAGTAAAKKTIAANTSWS